MMRRGCDFFRVFMCVVWGVSSVRKSWFNISLSNELSSLRMSSQHHIENVLQIALDELCASGFRNT